MKKMIFVLGIAVIFASAGPLLAEPPLEYEGVLAGSSANFSFLNANQMTSVSGTDLPSLDYSSRSSGAGIFSAGMTANVYQTANDFVRSPDFTTNPWSPNQGGQPLGNFASYSKKVSVSGIINNFRIGFYYQGQSASTESQSISGLLP